MSSLSVTRKTGLVALLLAVVCSILVGGAQLIVKWGVERVRSYGWTDTSGLLLLLLSYAILGLGLVVLLLALRSGELSTVYPVLASRYVWVVALTPVLFPTESLNSYKIVGAVVAAVGVAVIGRAGLRYGNGN